ncbi:hypothetical protein L210DRAFT_3545798 [Boletus edulis BED1]|uniref:Uncharacterized protein n=1 Tax=Boletus edulis BED1 TaxID=1328754 RepID=A0AAD4GDU4_BOLED|nr:hypothetical protein L210DRAFT_3545798 [Boletus edulis BED1]
MITRAAAKAKRAEMISNSSPESDNVSAEPPPFVPFQMGPSLERIPDDVLLEIVSHLPTLDDHPRHTSSKRPMVQHVIPSTILVRTSTLRALSQTSRLLRSRCLAMAWQNVELCGEKLLKYNMPFYDAFGAATETAIRVLEACPYLLPFIQTVSVMLTSYRYTEIIPEFAACLATLPNLSAIHVVHTEYKLMTAIRNAFRGIRLPSVRRISLPSLAHEIIRSCPNVEEVVCLADNYEGGGRIIQSLAECKCYHVRMVKGICAPLTHMTPLIDFPHLDTIEILVQYLICQERQPLSEIAASAIEKAREILKGNKSQAEKTVVLRITNSHSVYGPYEFAIGKYVTREIIKV